MPHPVAWQSCMREGEGEVTMADIAKSLIGLLVVLINVDVVSGYKVRGVRGLSPLLRFDPPPAVAWASLMLIKI